MSSMKNNQSILTFVLVAIIIVLVGYILVLEYQQYQQRIDQRMFQALQQGYNRGAEDVLGALLRQTDNCQVATVTLNTTQRRVVDVSCIQTTEQASSQQLP